MLRLAQFENIDPIYVGLQTMVYRAWQVADGKPVIIKTLRNTHPSFRELVQFRNQFVISSNLDSPHIVKPIALERYENGYLLIMPDQGAISLKQYLLESTAESKMTEIGEGETQSTGKVAIILTPPANTWQFVLKVGLQLAIALHHLSAERVVHKDIKPANILIHPKTGYVQLIDFSIASLLPKEQQEPVNPEGLEGTLAYIAPEQTGRMNRGIDYRTDFYSLGVTLYELLTGQRPFSAAAPLELLYCHIAQNPVPPVDLKDAQGQPYPAMLSAIIMKLMAKNAEERYQSALGLQYDLERCLHSLHETGEIATFQLGERDLSDRFNIPEKLYGREQEVQTLLEAFERVANGNSEIMLVAGFSGIGKTAVVNEVHKPIARQQGYFIKGKFDQFNRNIPFSAFVQAFRHLIQQLLGESDAQLRAWKGKILEAVGESGQILIDVIPELERLIGQQTTVPELTGSAAQNRFNLLFERFVTVFTSKKHPLTIFLDDLQWADSASLSLIKVLIRKSQTQHLLLLGAYRNNEVFPAHPLLLTLKELKTQNAIVSEITLQPLPEYCVNQLVVDTLNCSVVIAAPLTQLIYQKTKGNPFFSTQFLQCLYEDGLIELNHILGYWQCDLVKIQEVALTEDVIDFLVRRLHRLSSAAQKLLKLAACIGNQFDLETLAIICEVSPENIAESLWEVLREGLILPQSETYKFFQAWDGDRPAIRHHPSDIDVVVNYRFLHDRVQQAAYALIAEEDRKSIHWQIGRLLLQATALDQRKAKLFNIVNQLNLGREFINHVQEQTSLAELNLQAGQQAQQATAHIVALDYFETGIALLPTDAWGAAYELTLNLHEGAAEMAYLAGKTERMEALVTVIKAEAHHTLDTVRAIQAQMQHYGARGDFQLAVQVARKFLQKLGINLPEQPTFADLQQELEHFDAQFSQLETDELINQPLLEESKGLAAARILALLCISTIISDFNLFGFVTLELIKLSITKGNSQYSPYGYICYGIILNAFKLDIDRFFSLGKVSLAVLTNFERSSFACRTFQVIGAYITHLKKHVRETFDFLEKAYLAGLDSGDFEFAGYSLFTKYQNAYFLGQELTELQGDIKKGLESLEYINQKSAVRLTQNFEQLIANLIGQSEEPANFASYPYNPHWEISMITDGGDRFGLHYFYLNKAYLKYLFCELDQGYEALEFTEKAGNYLDVVGGFLIEPIFYFYDSLIRLNAMQRGKQSQAIPEPNSLEKVHQNQQKMALWQSHAPMNFRHKFDLVEAEKCRVLDQKLEAIALYSQAITGAKEQEYIQEEALANELFAKFYLSWGRDKEAAVYMQDAYY